MRSRHAASGVTVDMHAFPLIAVVLAIGAAAGVLAIRLHQPLIVAFIGVGILVGPTGTGWVTGEGTIELLATLGIAILLFLVGLRLDPHLIRTTGSVALVTGLGQVVFTALLGYLIASALGMDLVPALYVAIALTFSSTIIVVKLLSDRGDLEHLHGRIAVGFLIVQDIVVILVMIALSAFGQRTGAGMALDVALVFGKGTALLAGIAVLMYYVLPVLLHQIARSQELLVLFGVAYAVSIAAASEQLGFNSEVGAFLAGISLAGTPYRDALGARLVSLRDFLLLFFFLNLGANLEFDDVGRQLGEAAALSAFVLLAHSLIVMAIMTMMRYPVRVAFLTGLAVSQISEFSLIVAALGLELGHIDNTTVSIITVVGLVTIGGSSYLIQYSHRIYDRLERVLLVFERGSTRADPTNSETEFDGVVYGLGRFGGHVAGLLGRAGHRVLAVDFDPHRVASTSAEGVTAVHGSAEDAYLLELLSLSRARFVISTIPLLETNAALLHGLRQHDYGGKIALTAHTRHDSEQLRAAGVDIVLEPFTDAARAAADVLHELVRDDGEDGSRDRREDS
ncbi:cation:proton antiporter [Saccharopolyspora mangrovi]|uniref:Cation:proton antiporter family protein n=1 Tax=Saccharopolyspora mangrovi TaxID=3082379 RepID=A0ABU6AIS1_9PSEU|nr:cation:proton antiporter family protein [Saccharopolyspora sp. S2-29]MEB3371326.1 cation:proton antiporter family protein [Saccharopolyspora sp. S2-29]